MKKLLFIIVFVIFCNIQYTNAQSLFIDEDVFYFELNWETIWPINVDSTAVENGNTTLFFNEGMLSLYGSDCIDTAGPNILGSQLTILQNGDYHFFNRYGDTIKIDMNAPVDSTWVCYQDSNLTVSVVVLSIESSSFNGYNEDVHTFKFLVEGDPNYNMTVDQRYLKIGETNGIISTFSWVSFPYIYEFLQLGNRVEKSSFQNDQYPTFGEAVNSVESDIFNFQVGDELHFTKRHYRDNPFVCDVVLSKLSVLERSDTEEEISLKYYRENQTGVDSIYVDSLENGHYFYMYNSIVEDTIIRHYSKHNLDYSMPLYFSDYGVNSLNIEFGRPAYIQSYFAIFPDYDSCAMLDDFMYGGNNDKYIKGLGGPYYDYSYFDYNGDYVDKSRVLSYYSLNDGSIYGAPIEFVSINNVPDYFDFKLYPNPANSEISIEIPSNEIVTQVTIVDMMGRIVYSEKVSDQIRLKNVDISVLTQGIYMLQILKHGNVVGVKRFVKQ